jgi:hypothetical protein
MTVSPVGSTRTTSNPGRSGAGSIGAPAAATDGAAAGAADFGSPVALAAAWLGPAVVEAGDRGGDAAPRSAKEDGATRAPDQTPANLGATITPAATATATAPAQYNALAEYMTTEPRR